MAEYNFSVEKALIQLLDDKKYHSLRDILCTMNPADIAAVETAFASALADFCRDMALRTGTVSYAKVLRLLLDTEGVADVTGFTLCGGGESLTLAETAVAVPGALALEEADT